MAQTKLSHVIVPDVPANQAPLMQNSNLMEDSEGFQTYTSKRGRPQANPKSKYNDPSRSMYSFARKSSNFKKPNQANNNAIVYVNNNVCILRSDNEITKQQKYTPEKPKNMVENQQTQASTQAKPIMSVPQMKPENAEHKKPKPKKKRTKVDIRAFMPETSNIAPNVGIALYSQMSSLKSQPSQKSTPQDLDVLDDVHETQESVRAVDEPSRFSYLSKVMSSVDPETVVDAAAPVKSAGVKNNPTIPLSDPQRPTRRQSQTDRDGFQRYTSKRGRKDVNHNSRFDAQPMYKFSSRKSY